MDLTDTQALDGLKEAAWPSGESQHFVEAHSPAMRAVEQIIANVAGTDLPLLLVGECGVGKESVAMHIHRLSRRKNDAFFKVVCGALTTDFFKILREDSEKGNGVNSWSKAGTLFLDEITELAPALQANLLHAIPDGEAIPNGFILNARIISATGRTPEELEDALRRGSLRKITTKL